MSIARSTLGGGPATLAFNSVAIHAGDDTKIDFELETEDLATQFFGPKVDLYRMDRRVKAAFRPLEYTSLSTLFPYLSTACGAFVLGSAADKPAVFNCLNQDKITIANALVTKMPSLFLGVEKPLLGDMEMTGIVADSAQVEAANSYYTIATGQAYTPIALTAGNILRQRYSAAWGAIAGFTAVQAKEGWTVDWELELEPVKVQGITHDYRFIALRAMAKCIPIGPTMAQIDTNLIMQGSGATEGARMGVAAADLVITGSGVSATIKNAVLKSAGFVFGGKPLRIGELGWVSTQVVSSGTATAVAVIA